MQTPQPFPDAVRAHDAELAGDPQIKTTTYHVADDRSVEAHVYSVGQDGAVLKVTVAELADTGLEESDVIDHAIKTLSEGSEVKVNIPHRVNRVFGRKGDCKELIG
jgi:hypothetical protein